MNLTFVHKGATRFLRKLTIKFGAVPCDSSCFPIVFESYFLDCVLAGESGQQVVAPSFRNLAKTSLKP